MAVVVLGGLFSGFFTATEAGAVGALAAVGISACTGRLNKQLLVQSAYDTLSTTSGLFVIAIGANLLTRFLSLSGATDAIGAFILSFGSSELLILVGIAVVYLLLGMFLEPIGAMLLTLPVFLPILSHFDTNLVWFGVFVAKLLEVGMITPPIGLNVFVVKGVTPPSVTLGDIFRGIFPFLFADALVLSAILLWPGLITSVVDLLS
jgi:TRAP-type C4-dicarboxylate transport system permease large subunit